MADPCTGAISLIALSCGSMIRYRMLEATDGKPILRPSKQRDQPNHAHSSKRSARRLDTCGGDRTCGRHQYGRYPFWRLCPEQYFARQRRCNHCRGCIEGGCRLDSIRASRWPAGSLAARHVRRRQLNGVRVRRQVCPHRQVEMKSQPRNPPHLPAPVAPRPGASVSPVRGAGPRPAAWLQCHSSPD